MDALLEAIVHKGPPDFSEPRQWSVELRDFVAVMLQKQPEARHDAARCLGHVFLSRGAEERGDTRRVLCRRCAALPKDAVRQPSTKPEVPGRPTLAIAKSTKNTENLGMLFATPP